MKKTFRIYGKVTEDKAPWIHGGRTDMMTVYREIEYREYTEDGELVGAGTREFNNANYRNEICEGVMYVTEGKLNKGGKKIWDGWFDVIYDKGTGRLVKEFYERKYGKELQIRKY